MKAQEERREEREVEAQEGHDGEEEMTTQETCVEAKKEMNSMYERSDVSNRHMTWWRKRRVGPCGQRTTPADGARPSTSVASSHEGSARSARDPNRSQGEEREKWEQGTTGRKESNTLHVVFHFPSNGNVTATATSATTAAAATAAAPAAAPQRVRLQ